MRARLRRFLPQWAQAGNIFLCGVRKNYLKKGMLDKGGRRDYFHRRL